MKPRIKAVIFDLDNTLIDFEKMKRLSCDAAIDAMIDNGLKMPKKKALKTIFNLYDKYGWEYQKIFQVFLKEVMGKVDYSIMVPGIIAYRRVKEGLVYSYPGVSLVLKQLRDEGYKLVILTDAPRLQAWLRICSLRIQENFEHVITYDDTRRWKPDKKPFLLALKKLKLKPENCLMIGDSIHRDIAAARRLGIKTAHAKYGTMKVMGKHRKVKSKPDFELKNIGQLPGIIRKINK
jgi:putative hydrolase of the HAD superfamily